MVEDQRLAGWIARIDTGNAIPVEEASADTENASPAKLAFTGAEPTAWLTEAISQLALPEASVAPVHACAARPSPSVNVTVLPASAVPVAGSSVVR